MSDINGVEYIPTAKIASLFVVFALVVVYNKLLDVYQKHQVFYLMGLVYGSLFGFISIGLLHPTHGLGGHGGSSPYKPLGWISYITIEPLEFLLQALCAIVD